jgi:hypothetical protein
VCTLLDRSVCTLLDRSVCTLRGSSPLSSLHNNRKNMFQLAVVYGLLGSWLADRDMRSILNLIMISACQVLS